MATTLRDIESSYILAEFGTVQVTLNMPAVVALLKKIGDHMRDPISALERMNTYVLFIPAVQVQEYSKYWR
jgi:hypothetical protein